MPPLRYTIVTCAKAVRNPPRKGADRAWIGMNDADHRVELLVVLPVVTVVPGQSFPPAEIAATMAVRAAVQAAPMVETPGQVIAQAGAVTIAVRGIAAVERLTRVTVVAVHSIAAAGRLILVAEVALHGRATHAASLHADRALGIAVIPVAVAWIRATRSAASPRAANPR